MSASAYHFGGFDPTAANQNLESVLDQTISTFTRWTPEGQVIEYWTLTGRDYEITYELQAEHEDTVTYAEYGEMGVGIGEPIIAPATPLDPYVLREVFTTTTYTSYDQHGAVIVSRPLEVGEAATHGTCVYTNADGTTGGSRKLSELEAVSLIDWSAFTPVVKTIEQKIEDLKQIASMPITTIDELQAAIAAALED